METSLTLALVLNAAVVATLILLVSQVRRSGLFGKTYEQLLEGVLYGGAAGIAMRVPFDLAEGFIVDGRSMVVSLAGAFGGPVPAIIASIIAAAVRISIGGAGALVGVVVVVASALIGLGFRFALSATHRRWGVLELGLLGASVHLVTPALIATIPEVSATTALAIGQNMLLAFVPGTIGAGLLLRDSLEFQAQKSALETSEARFRALAEQAVEGIFRVSLRPSRTIEYTNPALHRITGYGHDAFEEDPQLLWHRTHPDDVVHHDTPGTYTVRFRHADDSWHWLEIRQSEIVAGDGAAIAIQGLVIDVTDVEQRALALKAALEREQQATEDLRRLDDLKNTFLRAASHELRTPLSAIYGISATLHMLRERLDAEMIDYLWTRLDVNVERLRRLLDDLLDVNRLTAGEVTPQLESVDLAELAQRVADEVPMGHRSLHLDLAPTPAMVEPSKVERILHNLLANAVKHTPEATTVTVRTYPDPDGGAVLVVADDGPGIDPEIRDRLFKPFVQGEAAASSPQPGTGIGLSLVRELAGMHGATVSAGESPAGGAQFEVVFPTHV